MTKVVLITGASSGIGKVTAQRFQRDGWNVVATMRTPSDGANLELLDRVQILRLDVTDQASIEEAVSATIARHGAIDVLVNNAGYGAYGPLEAFDDARIRKQFDTNVFGMLAVTRTVLPYMRRRGSGMVINVSSIGGNMTFPLGTLYHGSKFAIEGLSEALHYELESIGIRVKVIEPGIVRTDFGGRSLDFANDPSLTEYQPIVGKFMGAMAEMSSQAVEPSVIAEVVLTAATDGAPTLRYPAGPDAETMLANRKRLDDATFIGGIKAQMNLAG